MTARNRQGFLFDTAPENRAANNTRTVTVSVETVHNTGKALLVNDGVRQVFIPWSLIEEPAGDIECPHVCQDITIPEWKAFDEELI
ncbi:MAG: hypothetical protein HQ512_04620 [Rhodospirillales bacterium]|nr:hypothetical protein [Rhodospirillales bacterium]